MDLDRLEGVFTIKLSASLPISRYQLSHDPNVIRQVSGPDKTHRQYPIIHPDIGVQANRVKMGDPHIGDNNLRDSAIMSLPIDGDLKAVRGNPEKAFKPFP